MRNECISSSNFEYKHFSIRFIFHVEYESKEINNYLYNIKIKFDRLILKYRNEEIHKIDLSEIDFANITITDNENDDFYLSIDEIDWKVKIEEILEGIKED